MLAIGTDRREIEIWSTATWQRLHTLPRHSVSVNDLAFSTDGASLLSVGERREETAGVKRLPEVFLWNTDSSKKIREIHLSHWTMTAQHVIFVGQALAVVGNHGGQLTMIDTNTGGVVGELEGHQNMIGGLAYDERNNLLISTSPEQTILWDMNCRKKAAPMSGSGFVAYTPKTGLIATAPIGTDQKTCILSRVVIGRTP